LVAEIETNTVVLVNNWLYFATVPSKEVLVPRNLWMVNINDFQSVTIIHTLKANDILIGNIDMDGDCSLLALLSLFVISPGNATSPTASCMSFGTQSKTPVDNGTFPSLPPFVSQRPSVRAVRRYAYRYCTDAGVRSNAFLAAGSGSAWGAYSSNGLAAFALTQIYFDDPTNGAAFDYDNDAVFVSQNADSDRIYVLTPSVVLGLSLPRAATVPIGPDPTPWPLTEIKGLVSAPVPWRDGFAAATWDRSKGSAVQAVFVNSSSAWKQDFSASRQPDLSTAALASCPQSSVVFPNPTTANVLYLVDSSGALFSLVADTGEVLWLSNATASTMPKNNFLPATPACDTTSAFVLHADTTRLLRISSRDGSVLWISQVVQPSPPPPAPPSSAPSPAASDPLLVGDTVFFFSSAAQVLSAVSRFSGDMLWSTPLPDTRVAQIANYGSQLVVVTDHSLLALDITSGASLWLIPVFDMVPMRPLVLLDALIFVDRVYGGRHYGLFVDPDSGIVLRNVVFGEWSDNPHPGAVILLFVILGIAHACGAAGVTSMGAVFFGIPVAQLDKTKKQRAPIKTQGDSVAFAFSVLYLGSLFGVVAWVVVIFMGQSVTATTISVAPSFVADALKTPTDLLLQFDLAGGLGLACDNRLRLKQDIFVTANNKLTPLTIKGQPRPTMGEAGCRVSLTCAGCSLAPSAVRRQYGCVEVTALEANVTEFGFAAARLGINSSASSQPSASFAARTNTIASSSDTPMLKPVFRVSATAFHSHHPDAAVTYNIVHFEGLSGSSNDSVLVDECRQALGGTEARSGTVYLHVSVDSTVVVRTAEYRHTPLALLLTVMTLSLQALSSFGAGTVVIRGIVEAYRNRKVKKPAMELSLIAAYSPTDDEDESPLIPGESETY
jgi:outer membrane protein assembly factor BamB